MKKIILLVLIPSFMLVACGGKEKENKEIVETTTSSSTTTTTVPENLPVENPVIEGTPTTSKPSSTPVAATTHGKVIGHMSIPSIGLEQDIREGIELSVLDTGNPGHYPHSPKPCRAGNAAIAGHRTTHGAPFNKLDLIKEGDVINITTPEGDCTYKYVRTEIVVPTNVSVVMPKDGNANEMTLTACHPKGSAKQRIVVTAKMISVTPK